MTAVRDLEPGQVYVMDMTGDVGTVIVTTSHPIYANGRMALVVWWLHRERRYTFDALDWRQELPLALVSGRNEPEKVRAWRDAMREANL